MLGDRRHKDELDSGDDSDNGRHDNDEVSLGGTKKKFQKKSNTIFQICLDAHFTKIQHKVLIKSLRKQGLKILLWF